jgi:hypothetical protein
MPSVFGFTLVGDASPRWGQEAPRERLKPQRVLLPLDSMTMSYSDRSRNLCHKFDIDSFYSYNHAL